MTHEAARLDGNAAAGLLVEVFGSDMTAAMATCDQCGAHAALATTLMYSGGPGTVLRCSTCSGLLMRFARINGRLRFELRGIRAIELPASHAS